MKQRKRVCDVNRDIYVPSLCKNRIQFAVRIGEGCMTSYYCPTHTREYADVMIRAGEPFVVALAGKPRRGGAR